MLAYLSSQATSEPTSLLENAPVVEEVTPQEAPELSEDMPVTDTPELSPTEESADLPEIEEEPAPDQE